MKNDNILIRRASREDLEEVLQVERESFDVPWSKGMFEHEVFREEGLFLVARDRQGLLGYADVIFILEEGHVANLAVKKDRRREGVATLLVLVMIKASMARGIRFFTLEVRRSNQAAINLYHKFGFEIIGERRHYYMDGEDALIMWTEDIHGTAYKDLLGALERDVNTDRVSLERGLLGD